MSRVALYGFHIAPVELQLVGRACMPEAEQPEAATGDVAKVIELLNQSPELTTQLLQLLGGVVSQGTVRAVSAN